MATDAGSSGSGDQETLDYYSAEARAYADRTAGEADSPSMARFTAMLPAGGAVLDFGCGPAWAAHRFQQQGFEVTAMDGSTGLAEEAMRRYGVVVTVGNFDEFSAEAAFDGIWASFSLLHDTRAAMPGHLQRLHRALRPNGALYIGLKEGTGEMRDSLNRRYTYFELSEMERLLTAAGFHLDHHDRDSVLGMDGVEAKCIHLFAHRD